MAGLDAPSPPASPLAARGVSRSFGHTRALERLTLELRAGEVHAVAGENGSGKSTLVKILSGVLAPDKGCIAVDGIERPGFASPAESARAGVATVFQEVLVVDSLTVLENVWIGCDGELRWRIPAERRRADAERAIERLLGRPLDLDGPVERLDLSVRQVLTIARALVRAPRVLILDEPTSALDVELRDRLLDVAREQRDAGTAVVFISHRMDEIEAIADRVTVLRSGCHAGTLERGAFDGERVVKLMSPTRGAPVPMHHRRRAEPVLTLDGVVLRPGRRTVKVTLHAGEVVGLAGLEGHGQEEFLRVLAGVDRPLAGTVTRHTPDGSSPLRSPRDAVRQGVVYVPRDRKSEGVFEGLSITDNFSIATLARDRRLGLVSERRRARRLAAMRERLGIAYRRAADALATLSGGNQQKVLMARWLAADPAVCALNDPTRGVDLSTKRDLYGLLDEMAADGVAVAMVSTEVEEHLTLMDRVLVFREGELLCELSRADVSAERLVGAMFGRLRKAVA